MLTAYFDETNISPNQKVPAVAGFIASTFQWSRFGEQWDKLLRRWQIPIDPRYGIRVAHRTDLQHCGGVFKKMGWTETDRDQFLPKAYTLIRRHTKIPIGNAVTRKDFETIALKPMQKIMGGAYGWCAYTCLHQVKRYCDQHDHKEPVDFVFEMGAPGWGQVNQLFGYLGEHEQLREYYRVGSISFVTKKTRQLQAADFLAYDLGRFFLDYKMGRTRSEVLASLRALIGPTKSGEEDCVAFWDEKSLEGHAKMLGELGLFQGQSLLVPTSIRSGRK